jgi:ferredoxin
MAYTIDQSRCINCAWCRRVCPTETIFYFDTDVRKHRVEPSGCIDCDICAQVCPTHCITHDPGTVPPPDQLEAAKAKARAWAGNRRRLRLAVRSYAEQVAARVASNGHDA